MSQFSESRELKHAIRRLAPSWLGGKQPKPARVFPDELLDRIASQLGHYGDTIGMYTTVAMIEEWMSDNGLELKERHE